MVIEKGRRNYLSIQWIDCELERHGKNSRGRKGKQDEKDCGYL